MTKPLKYLLLSYLFIPIIAANIFFKGENSYLYLAYSLLHGSFSLVLTPRYLSDISLFNGIYLWTPGPFPSILLMPFVWIFKLNFQEVYLKVPLLIINFILVYKIGRSLKLSINKAYLLAIFYIFGSTYLLVTIIPFSIYLSSVVVSSLLLFAVHEFLNSRRWWLIGIAIAASTMTRYETILISIFFGYYLWKEHPSINKIVRFTSPIAVVIILLVYYNFVRFGSFFDSGYKYQIIPQESVARRNYGVFSPIHIPTNLYYMLIKTPDAVFENNSHVLKPPYLKFDDYGMSIFVMSPILFLIFTIRLKDKYNVPSLLTITAMLIPISTYYGIGYRQVGYWHALDFFPLLIFPLAEAIKRTKGHWVFLLVSAGVFISSFFVLEMIVGY